MKKKDPAFVKPEDRPQVNIVSPDYQPSKAELEADTRLGGVTFDEAVQALTKPVRVNYVKRPKARARR